MSSAARQSGPLRAALRFWNIQRGDVSECWRGYVEGIFKAYGTSLGASDLDLQFADPQESPTFFSEQFIVTDMRRSTTHKVILAAREIQIRLRSGVCWSSGLRSEVASADA